MANILIIDHSAECIRLMKGATERALRIVGGKAVGYAQDRVSTARGPMGNPWPQNVVIALRQSLTCEVDTEGNGPHLRVGSNMQVAPYIELGTGMRYEPPPEWEAYYGKDGHTKGGIESWVYFDELEGVFKIGKPVPSTPYLRPAILDHMDEYKDIVHREMLNA